jgi:hypothetical protein
MREKYALDERYGKIGIAAVAAAFRYTTAPASSPMPSSNISTAYGHDSSRGSVTTRNVGRLEGWWGARADLLRKADENST